MVPSMCVPWKSASACAAASVLSYSTNAILGRISTRRTSRSPGARRKKASMSSGVRVTGTFCTNRMDVGVPGFAGTGTNAGADEAGASDGAVLAYAFVPFSMLLNVLLLSVVLFPAFDAPVEEDLSLSLLVDLLVFSALRAALRSRIPKRVKENKYGRR